VREGDLPRVKRDPRSSVERLQGDFGPVLDVPQDRETAGCKLNPELMTSPRYRVELELGVALTSREDAKVDRGFLTLVIADCTSMSSVELAVLGKHISPGAGLFLRRAHDDCPVEFRDRAGSKLLGKPGGRFARLGQKHDARGRPVEPMEKPQINISRLGVVRLQVVRGDVDQARLTRPVSLREEPGGLVHGQAMVVLEEDVQLDHAELAPAVMRLTMIVA